MGACLSAVPYAEGLPLPLLHSSPIPVEIVTAGFDFDTLDIAGAYSLAESPSELGQVVRTQSDHEVAKTTEEAGVDLGAYSFHNLPDPFE